VFIKFSNGVLLGFQFFWRVFGLNHSTFMLGRVAVPLFLLYFFLLNGSEEIKQGKSEKLLFCVIVTGKRH